MLKIRNLSLLLCCGLLVACGEAPKPRAAASPGMTTATTSAAAAPDADRPVTDPTELAFDTDPCATRLQDIAGSLLMYYITNHRLPPKLSDLSSYASAPLNFTCPASHLPYVYDPVTLSVDAGHPQLILYDAKPVHEGQRWGIVGRPAEGKQPETLWVVHFNQQQMEVYQGKLGAKPPPTHRVK